MKKSIKLYLIWLIEILEILKKSIGISWSIKELKGRLSIPKLNLWTKNNRVSSKPPKSRIQLEASIEALENFKASKTHTPSGIKKVIKKQKEAIKERFKEMKKPIDITDKEAEYLYLLFENKDATFFIDKIGASTFQNEIHNVIEAKGSDFEYFVERMKRFFDGEFDDDVMQKLDNLYNIILDYKDEKQTDEAFKTLEKYGVKY